MKSGSQIAALTVAIGTALWHVVWWGMMSPALTPPRHEQPTTRPIRLVETTIATGEQGTGSLDARSLRNPTLFAFPGGPGFSSFLMDERFGLSPRLAPMDFSVSVPAPASASTAARIPALLGAAALTPEQWLTSAERIMPAPIQSVTPSPRAAVRVGFRGIDPAQLRPIVDWQRLASLKSASPWTASAEVEFLAGRPVALMFAAQHNTPPALLPALRRKIMELRALDQNAGFLVHIDISVSPTSLSHSSAAAP